MANDQNNEVSSERRQPRKLLVFSDFDGTITTQDTGTLLIDHCMGYENRRALDHQILNGTLSFRDAVKTMWDSVHLPWDDAISLLKDVKLDPHFPAFHTFCITHNIPLTILSSGLTPLIEIFLESYISEPAPSAESQKDTMAILANEIIITPIDSAKHKWDIQYRDETPHGHDKSIALKEARKLHDNSEGTMPLIVFIGDGVSDISAAREADIIFAKQGKDLEQWCMREGVEYIPWKDYGEILAVLETKL